MKTTRIELRINSKDKNILKKAAELKGQTLSAYIISKTLESAKNEVEIGESFVLNDSDRDFFFNLINNPPSPNEALKKLMKSSSY